MGLDMYLSAKRSLWGFDDDDKKLQTKIQKLFPELKNTRDDHNESPIRSVSISAAYWRKSNHIHKWFVDNVQDGNDNCEPHYVPREKLEELKKICEEVYQDHTLAEEKLPTQAGFFFGDTDITEWYFNDIQQTIYMLEQALKFPELWTFEYCSSW